MYMTTALAIVLLCLHGLQVSSVEQVEIDTGGLVRRQELQPSRGKYHNSKKKKASKRAITIGDEEEENDPSDKVKAALKAVNELLDDSKDGKDGLVDQVQKAGAKDASVEELLKQDPADVTGGDFANADVNNKDCLCPTTILPVPLSKLDALKIIDSCTPDELMRKSGSDAKGAAAAGLTALGNSVADFGGRLLNAGIRFASWNFPNEWSGEDAKKAYEKIRAVLREELALKSSTCSPTKQAECKCPDSIPLPATKLDALKILDACTQADFSVMAGDTTAKATSAGIAHFGNAIANFGGQYLGPGSHMAAWNYPNAWSSVEAKSAHEGLKTILRNDLNLGKPTCGEVLAVTDFPNHFKWEGGVATGSPPKADEKAVGEVPLPHGEDGLAWKSPQPASFEKSKETILYIPKNVLPGIDSAASPEEPAVTNGSEAAARTLFTLPTTLAACIQNNTAYYPLNMKGHNRTWEQNHMACKDRCTQVEGCAHWTYYLVSEGCHVQDSTAASVTVKGVVSATPNCSDPVYNVRSSYGNANPLVQVMGQDCYHLSVGFVPLDMYGINGTRESDYERCQARCKATANCATFVYFINDQGCHLQEADASNHMVFVPGTISGKSSCTSQEKLHFEQFLENLPPGQIKPPKHSAQTACEDTITPFVPIDLNTSDLQKHGDLTADSLVSCPSLGELKADPQVLCAASQQVMRRCPKTCQICDLVSEDGGTCADVAKDTPPIFWLENEALPCSAVAYACTHDRDIDLKCRKTCGWCSFLSTTSTTTESTETTTTDREPTEEERQSQALSCSRRREMGFCYTRRRRIL